jgi:hypothetical protein
MTSEEKSRCHFILHERQELALNLEHPSSVTIDNQKIKMNNMLLALAQRKSSSNFK